MRRSQVTVQRVIAAGVVLCAAAAMPGCLHAQPTDTPALTPGGSFTIEFPEMPPTLAEMQDPKGIPATMAVSLPADYDPQRKHPLLVFLYGSNGGRGTSASLARQIAGPNEFVCVNFPLFKAGLAPGSPINTPAAIIIQDADGQLAWPLYRQMLARLDEAVPNLDPDRQVIGGPSNGAHMVSALIDGSDGEATERFTAFIFAEGGGKLTHYERLIGKPFLMISTQARSLPRATEIADAANTAGAWATLLFEDIGQHGFPQSAYPKVGAWLRGPAMQPVPIDVNGGIE